MVEDILPLEEIDASKLEHELSKIGVLRPKKFMRALIDSYTFSGGFMGDCVELDCFEEHFYNHMRRNGLKGESGLLHLYVKALGQMRILVGHPEYSEKVCLDQAWEEEITDYLGIDS